MDQGEWVNDKLEGYAFIVYQNGDIYEGCMRNDIRDGYGCIYYKNGDIIERFWKNGTIESNEYLDLSRLFGYSGSWDKIFTTEGTLEEPDKGKNPAQEDPKQLTPQ